MASQVAIANRALTKLGEARIISLDEDSKASNTISSMYDIVRDAELRAHRWHFAKARAVLPALSAKPDFGFRFQYQLPSDYISLIQLADFYIYPKADYSGLYSIEGNRILTNASAPLRIRYIRRINDPNLFDALFVESFACRLAAEACETITQSNTKKQTAWQEYDQAIRLAVRTNAVERPSQAISEDTWLESRR